MSAEAWEWIALGGISSAIVIVAFLAAWDYGKGDE